MDILQRISLPNISRVQVLKIIIVIFIVVLMTVLSIIVKGIASPLKPNSGRDKGMLAVKYNALVHNADSIAMKK